MKRPHVVLLGAGASRATCLNGDKFGRILPLMQDFVDVVGLRSLLQDLKINPEANFEEIFSGLWENNETEKVTRLQKEIEKYFDRLELPDRPTIYDHLVLSLRPQDLIATFNWDPLLLEAYWRNGGVGLSLPRLAFLHGNIRVGYCEKDRVAGRSGAQCRHCGEQFTKAPLLYPIKKKNYSTNALIANEWKQLRWGFANAFTITVFGSSGPKTDQEAIEAMQGAWGEKNKREMEQTALIIAPSQDENKATENWDKFIHTHHYEIQKDFYDSWIARHPRRTGEAYWNQYMEAKFIENNPIPKDLDLPDLWKWFERFKKAEG